MKNDMQLSVINQEINAQLADPSVGRALLATTFKGLNPVSMKQAIMEGMIRGFKFRDFLEKNVYAIPFKDAYALVTSIDYARKIGGRSGVVGKSAPTYGDEEGMGLWCSITIKKRSGGYVGDFTSKVYFKEFSTGRNLWTNKPRMMIAKVAEMHALRMACPEELAQTYAEEELEAEQTIPHEPIAPYKVERIVAAEDDDEQSEPVHTAPADAEKKEDPDDAIEHMFDDDDDKKGKKKK